MKEIQEKLILVRVSERFELTRVRVIAGNLDCVDKLSESQISLVGELTSAIALIFDEMCGIFTFS